MPRYAWLCRTCQARIYAEPSSWPALQEAHDALHALDSRLALLDARISSLERACPGAVTRP